MSRPPVGFVDLVTAFDLPKNNMVSVIGTVVDLMPPKPTTKGETTMVIKILDPAIRDTRTSEGLPVRFFSSTTSDLPAIGSVGDIVLLRRVKRWEFNDARLLITSYNTQIVVFPKASIPTPGSSTARSGQRLRLHAVGDLGAVGTLTQEEQMYVISLHHALSPHVPTNASPEGPALKRTAVTQLTNELAKRPKVDERSAFGAKFRLVAGLRHMEFADILVEVVKRWNAGQKVELYVTDYTENKDLWLYDPPEAEIENDHGYEGDPYQYQSLSKKNWAGPWGQRVLKVNVMEPHAATARTVVKEGSIVWLHNLKGKANPEGKLEGDMWPDASRPLQNNVRLIKSRELPEIQRLLKRKEAYWAVREKQQSRPEPAEPSRDGHTPAQATKRGGGKKKKNRAGQARTEDPQRHDAAKTPPVNAVNAMNEKNQHIRCAHPEAQVVNLREVIDASNDRHKARDKRGDDFLVPFINAKYRTKVRVVDFHPKSLVEFAVPALAHTQTDSLYDDAMETDMRYEWFFSLLLEDASAPAAIKTTREQIWVRVQHKEAQYLFGNGMGDPADLRQSSRLLALLKEKLCILWGNLEEKGDNEPLKNMPFECCVSEYGVEVPVDDARAKNCIFGWQKMFALFGTTIL